MQTADEQKLFQTDAQLLTAELRLQKSLGDKKPTETNGYPIVLASKPLKILVDGDDVYVAQNGFVAQRIDLKTGEVTGTFRGHAGPVTSIAIYVLQTALGARKLLITGSWDKSIKIWDTVTQIQLSTSVVHRDFVKSVEVIGSLGLLASGSTDRDILLWDLRKDVESYDWAQIDKEHCTRKVALSQSRSATTATALVEPLPSAAINALSESRSTSQEWANDEPTQQGRLATVNPGRGPMYGAISRVDTLKSHTRPIDALAVCQICTSPKSDQDMGSRQHERALRQPSLLVSGDTMGALKVWYLFPTSDPTRPVQSRLDLTRLLHQTSINSIQIVEELDSPPDVRLAARLWTASSDHSVLLSSLNLMSDAPVRLVSLLRLEQPYYVRCALQLASHIAIDAILPNWLITGSTDEDLRVYDLDKIDEEVDYTSSLSNQGLLSNSPELRLQHAWFGCIKAHWHEVCSLAVWVDRASQKSWIISASLDGTLRKWEIGALRLRFAGQQSGFPVPSEAVDEKIDIQLSTAEEAELAELMDSLN